MHTYVCIVCVRSTVLFTESTDWGCDCTKCFTRWPARFSECTRCYLQYILHTYVRWHTVHFRQCYKCTTPCKNGVTYVSISVYVCTCNYSMWNMGIHTYVRICMYIHRLTENTPYMHSMNAMQDDRTVCECVALISINGWHMNPMFVPSLQCNTVRRYLAEISRCMLYLLRRDGPCTL